MSNLSRTLARSRDLALAVGLFAVLVALMLADSVHPVVSAARLVVGLVFVLFVPGYCLLAALLPRSGALDHAERIGISIGVSVALIPILALLLDWLPWGLRPWPIVVAEGTVTLVLAGIALWQRRHLRDDAPVITTGGSVVLSWTSQLTRVERIAYPLVLVLALVAGIFGLQAVVSPTPDDLMTELYVLGRSGLAEQFPRVVETGEPVSVTLGLVNRELFERTYRVEAWTRDAWSTEPGTPLVPPRTVSVAPQERLEWPMTWQMPQPGDDQAIDVVVYVDDDAEPYRRVRLWLDVLPASSTADAQAARPDSETASAGIHADLTSPAAGGATPPVPPSEHLPLSVPAPVAAGVVPTLPVAATDQNPRERGRITAATPVPTADPAAAVEQDADDGANVPGGAAPRDGDATGHGGGGAPVGPLPDPAARVSGSPDPRAASPEATGVQSSEPTPAPDSVSAADAEPRDVEPPAPGAARGLQRNGGSDSAATAGLTRVLAELLPWWSQQHPRTEMDSQPPDQESGVTVPTSVASWHAAGYAVRSRSVPAVRSSRASRSVTRFLPGHARSGVHDD